MGVGVNRQYKPKADEVCQGRGASRAEKGQGDADYRGRGGQRPSGQEETAPPTDGTAPETQPGSEDSSAAESADVIGQSNS